MVAVLAPMECIELCLAWKQRHRKKIFKPLPFQGGVSCRDVYLHAMNCPVCMAYYNRDNTALYIVLVSLIIVVLFLLKKHYDLCFVGAPPKK